MEENVLSEIEEVAKAHTAFKQLMEIFTNVLQRYDGGRKQLVRAWTNAAISPLNQSPLAFSYPEEQEIFNIYRELEGIKLVLMVYGLRDAGVLTLHKPLMSAIESEVKQESETTKE